jgi:hypothetical protein
MIVSEIGCPPCATISRKMIKYNHLIANLQILHNCRAITLALKELEIEGRATNAGLLLIYEGILSAP